MNNIIFPVVTENERKLPFYLIGVGCRYIQDQIIRLKGYPSYQWIQCHGGEGELILEGKTYPIKENQGMLLYPNVPHEYYPVKDPWMVDWVTFGGYAAQRFIENMGVISSGVYYTVNSDAILSKMRKMLAIGALDNSLKGIECSTIIYELLIDLMKYTSKSSEDSIQQQRLKLEPVLNYIEHNYCRGISLEDMATVINVTPQHLCLLFKNIMGIRPFEYMNSVRVNKSKDMMIKDGSIEIGRIASLSGFENVSYFCAVFRKLEKLSPGKFKKLHGL